MGDLRALLQRVSQDLQDPNVVDSTKTEYDQANLAIIDAIRELQHEEFWFNGADTIFPTVEGQETYAVGEDLPADLIYITSQYLYLEFNQNPRTVWEISRASNSRFDYLQSAYTTPSDPLDWRFWQNKLWLRPVPNATVHNIKFRYIKDCGVPSKRWDGSSWVFDEPTWGSSEVAQAWQEDNSGPFFVDVTSDINDPDMADVMPFPAGAGADDALYVGFARRATSLDLNVGTAGDGTYTVTWEYSTGNGTWSALADVTDGSDGFKILGESSLTFTDPSTAWKKDVVNGSSLLFWIRARRDGGTVTTDPALTQVEGVGNASPWMNEAERLVRARVCYKLCMEYFSDEKRSQMYLQRALEAQQDLRQREEDMHRSFSVEPWI